VNELLTYAIMLALLILAQVQFVIRLMELKKKLNQKLMYLCSKTAMVLSEWTVLKTKDMSLLHFHCIRIK
jgi:uncharacterized protein YoxC